VFLKFSTEPVPPVTNTFPVGKSVRFIFTRPNVMSPDECHDESEAETKLIVFVVGVAVTPTSVSRVPHFITNPGLYITAEPPLKPLITPEDPAEG
jgi:hypothetical protein